MTQPPYPNEPQDEPRYGVRLPPDQVPPRPVPGAQDAPAGFPGAPANPYGQTPPAPGAWGPPANPYGGGPSQFGPGQPGQFGPGQPGQFGPGQVPGDPYAGGWGGGGSNPTEKNSLAVWSLVLGLAAVLCGPASIVGIVLGAQGRKAAASGRATNGSLALVGMVVSIITCVLWIISVFYLFSSGQIDEILRQYN